MKLAVLIPLYRDKITPDEKLSVSHLEKRLSEFEHLVIKPANLDKTLPGCATINFPDHHFASISAYSRLLLSPTFYSAFVEFDYILIYQLDCLVFSSELHRWCEMGFDYIGAPLFEKNSQPPRLSRVGNGGLSLRRVGAFLNVLDSRRIPAWHEILTRQLPDLHHLSLPVRWRKKLRVIRDARRGIKWYTSNYGLNEDLFWSDRARLFHPSFKIAPVEVALRFAFDAYPRVCFEQNGRQLPFGAHGWTRWDRAFWEPHLLS